LKYVFLRNERRRLLAGLAAALAIHAGVALLIELSGAGSGGHASSASSPRLKVTFLSVDRTVPNKDHTNEGPDGEGEGAAERLSPKRSTQKELSPEQKQSKQQKQPEQQDTKHSQTTQTERTTAARKKKQAASEKEKHKEAEKLQTSADGQSIPKTDSLTHTTKSTEQKTEQKTQERPEGGGGSRSNRSSGGSGSETAPGLNARAEAGAPLVPLAGRVEELVAERKVYPQAAQRRGIEGDVVLRLRIYPDGRLKSLELVGDIETKILARAAERLVRSVFPLDAEKRFDTRSCRITVRYQLE